MVDLLTTNLNISFFIAKRLSGTKGSSFSSSVHKIAVAGIAIGLGTMIVSFLILGGFKKNITNKLFSLSGHLRIMKYTLESSFEEEPISTNNNVFQHPEQFPFISQISEYAHKAGLIKTEEEVQG